MRPDNRTTAPGPTTPGGSRRGYTLFGLLLAITFVGLVLGLVVAARELANRRHSMTGLAISADGGTIAAAFGDGRVRVFDTSAGRELALSTQPDDDGLPSRAMTLSRDGRLLATSSFVYDSTGAYADGITIFDTRLGTFLREIKTQEYHQYFEFSPDSRSLVLDSDFAAPTVIDVETGAETRLLRGPAGKPPDFVSIHFAPDGKTLVATITTRAQSAGPSDIELFNVADGTARGVRYALGAYYVTHVKFSPDSARLALCESISARKPAGGGPTLTMLNAETLAVEATADLGVHGIVYVQEVEFTPDRRSLIVITASQVYYFDARTLELESAHPRPPGYRLAAAREAGAWALENDGTITLYDSRTREPTGVRWHYRESPWPLLIVLAGLGSWFVAFAMHVARSRRANCEICGRVFRGGRKLAGVCPACQRNYVAIERSRYPLTFRQAIALSILITVVAVCAIGDAEAGGKTWLWAATALVTLALIVLVARNLRARRAYRRKALSPARSTKSASGQLVAVYDIDPSGDVSAGLTVPFGEVLSKSAHRARRTFAELTGVDARFAANLTAASYATAEAFNDDLRLFRTDACEQPCTYIAWPAPRVVICESAAHEQLVEMSDALTAALTYGLWGSGLERVPVWLLIGLAHRCAVKGRAEESWRLNRSVLASVKGPAPLGPAMFNESARGLWARFRRTDDPVRHAFLAQFESEAASLVEYLTAEDAPPNLRDAFRACAAGMFRGIGRDRDIAAHLGISQGDLLNQWMAWVRARGTGTFSAPAGWQQQVIQDILLPVLRDKNVETMRRLRAIRALGEQGFLFGADALIDVLADTAEESDVRTAAYWALESITGQSFGANIEAWRMWWDAFSESSKRLAADSAACTLKP